jgi:predicted CoA-binding protein
MVTQKEIQNFLSQKSLAVIGVSRNNKEFANSAYRLLKSRGYTVYPINPFTEQVEGDRCYPNIKLLPERVNAALVMLPPEKTMKVLPEITEAGVEHVWLQQQTDSPQAIQFCKDRKINVVYGECIMMFSEPLTFPHGLHRWGKKVFGSLPK